MNQYFSIIPAALAVLLDLSFAPSATLLGVRPSLTLVLVSLWSALRPQSEAMVMAPTAGLLLGLLGNETLGVAVIAFAPIVLIGGLNTARGTERRFLFAVGLVASGTFMYAVAHLIGSRIAGGAESLDLGGLRVLATVAFVNCALAALLYWPVARSAGRGLPRADMRRYG